MDIKISQLANAASVVNTDLLEISTETGGGTYGSRKIQFRNIKESLVGKKTVTVSQGTGADANTIKDGIALAALMSPSILNPVTVIVSSGLYLEENPLVIPDYVSVVSQSDANSTEVAFIIPSANGFELGLKTILDGFSIYSYAADVVGVYFRGAFSVAKDITIINCQTGYLIENADAVGDSQAINCNVTLIPGAPSNCDVAFSVKNASFLTLYNCFVWGLDGTYIGTAFSVEDDDSGIDIYATSTYACNNGYVQTDNCICYMEATTFGTCDTAIQCSGGTLYCTGVQVTDSTQDILVDDPSVILRFSGTADSTKLSIDSGADVTAQFQDLQNDLGGLRIIGKTVSQDRLVVGYPNATIDNPQILFDIGEGQAYTLDKYGTNIVEYWQYDSDAASGSRFTRYTDNAGVQLASNNSSVVVGCQYQYSSLRLDVLTAANVGSNSIVAEYWNGTDWIEVGMAVYKRDGWVHRANNPFQNIEQQFVEHSIAVYNGTDWLPDIDELNEIPLWETGDRMFAMRYRNIGDLVSGMTFEDGKVKGDGYQIAANTTKRITAWGRNRLTEQDTVIPSQYLPHTTNPADSYLVDISANIKSTVPNCKFTQSFKKAFCDLHYVQPYVDTSTPLILQIDAVPLDSDLALGQIHFSVYIVVLARGQVLSGSATEMVLDVIIPTYNLPNVILAGFASIDLSAYPTSTAIALTVERDSTGADHLDTYAGSVAVPLIIYNHTKKVI